MNFYGTKKSILIKISTVSVQTISYENWMCYTAQHFIDIGTGLEDVVLFNISTK